MWRVPVHHWVWIHTPPHTHNTTHLLYGYYIARNAGVLCVWTFFFSSYFCILQSAVLLLVQKGFICCSCIHLYMNLYIYIYAPFILFACLTGATGNCCCFSFSIWNTPALILTRIFLYCSIIDSDSMYLRSFARHHIIMIFYLHWRNSK